MAGRTEVSRRERELTLRGVALGALITVVFTAANVYLGLKVGLTFATSIPAAVISMAALRAFRGATILENNIVQTVASAAGTLSAIIFVLPGLVIIGWWTDFPYLTSVAAIGLGGILGVMLSVPLRRALVTGSDLPYPEGVAAAEVLRVGAGSREGAEENRRGLRMLLAGALASAAFAIIANARLIATEAAVFFRLGAGATSVSASFSLALIGVGHLVGVSVGLAMFAGMLVSWAALVPIFTAIHGVSEPLSGVVGQTFRNDVRLIGTGVIGAAALWTLLKILAPVANGVRAALAAARMRRRGQGDQLGLAERDLPIAVVAGVVALALAPIAGLLFGFAADGPIAANPWPIVVGSVVYVLIAGAVVAAICGYMAGLIGSSNSPISGVGILAALGAALLLAGAYGAGGEPARVQALAAYVLMTTAIVFGVATISNDNLQDLKTGQLVGATPWRQQVALVLGVVFGALIIPPVLNLLNATFGFSGAPGAGPDALAAPQATLIAALVRGVLGGDLDWSRIGIGAAIGAAAIALDEALGRAGRMRLPPLGVGMGVYLPMSITLLVPIGAGVGWLYGRWAAGAANPDLARRMGVLMATGLIVGESLFGVAFAGLVAGMGEEAPLALMPEHRFAAPLAAATFAGVIALLYAAARRAADR
ncbi:OPT family oligopeptide transporter [Hansschlegelia sp.]|uniref:OPT family oligopeptide transporter n=1 Tax=Hansschlegelia sp. TaxID=2041892 RepID=UPI002C6AC591|nr:oligopeptide transporter, OPT family [Hansschlegelia sp.]HVI30141.1 oligopeptide transporter, OPT family [Hansschlegelia sp.]